jgi:hypothetical protein
MSIKCSECQCTPQDCISEMERCIVCTKEVCCCLDIHTSRSKPKIQMLPDNCCTSGTCKNEVDTKPQRTGSSFSRFFSNVKSMYVAALGIEILCIAAAEIGENSGLFLFGFNHIGIPIAYVMGYSLATFTTFVTILGRYNYGSNDKIDSCCSVLEQESKGFISNLTTTFRNFGLGLLKLRDLPKQPNLKQILKTSIIILITAETACIITAETVDLIFYKQAIYLSIPLALFAGAFTVVAPEAYRKLQKNN